MRLSGRLGALQERPFRLLWGAQTLSSAGDALIPVAAVFAVLEISDSASAIGLVLTARLVPRVLLTVLGGVWADRLPRQLVMLASDVVRAAAHAATAVLLLTGTARLWHLVALSAVYGAGSAFFNPAATGIVPQTVSAARLQQANALIGLSRNVLNIAGPAVSGLVVAGAGPGWIFAADAASFAASGVLLVRLPSLRTRPPVRTSFLADLRRGWRELRSRSWVWASVVYFSIWNLAIAPFYVLGPFVADRHLGGATAWGLIMVGTAVGSLAGSSIALRLRPARPLFVAYAFSITGALQPAFLAVHAPALAIAAVSAVALASVSLANAIWLTTLQQHVPEETVSRVAAYEWMGSFFFFPVGLALAGPLADVVGIGVTLWGAAALLVASTVAVVSLGSVRTLRPLRPTPAAA